MTPGPPARTRIPHRWHSQHKGHKGHRGTDLLQLWFVPSGFTFVSFVSFVSNAPRSPNHNADQGSFPDDDLADRLAVRVGADGRVGEGTLLQLFLGRVGR